MKVTIIGFGEAGPVFAAQLHKVGAAVTAWDKLQEDASHGQLQIEKTQALGITPAASMSDALQSAELVISTVTASQALKAAEQAIVGLPSGCHWLDLNSVSPSTKQAIHDTVSKNGVLFTEGVAMDTVPSKGIDVPLLLCGPQSASLSESLNKFGFSTRSISNTLGAASTTKLLRSIMIKGMEALFAESMEAAGKVNMQKEVIASLQATYPELDWQEVAGYQLYRATQHATRRAGEMREAQNLVKQLGVEPIMTGAIAARQQNLSDRDVTSKYSVSSTDKYEPTIEDYIRAIDRS